jgi:hypothetical protein
MISRSIAPLLIWLMAGGSAWSQPLTKSTTSASLLFRREFVPSTILAKEAKGLVPIKRSEFEQLLSTARARDAIAAPDAWIESAEFEGELRGDLLVGTARFHIATRVDHQVALQLSGLKLPVRKPEWVGSINSPAIVGAAADGNLYAIVEKNGVLSFEWSLPARRDPWDTLVFDLASGAASRASWKLTINKTWQVDSSSGVLSSRETEDDTLRIWSLKLGD